MSQEVDEDECVDVYGLRVVAKDLIRFLVEED